MKVPARRFAAVVTSLAVGTVLGGTVLRAPVAAAAAQISGALLVNHSVAGKKLINDTVTGTQVKESSLGTVPNASRVGGQPPSAFLPASRLFGFSLAMAGQVAPAEITPLGSIGSVTFNGHCQISSSTVFSTIDAIPTHDGVVINGLVVPMGSLFVLTNDGSTANKTVTMDVAVSDPATGLVLQGQFTSIIKTAGANCRLFGHLVRLAG